MVTVLVKCSRLPARSKPNAATNPVFVPCRTVASITCSHWLVKVAEATCSSVTGSPRITKFVAVTVACIGAVTSGQNVLVALIPAVAVFGVFGGIVLPMRYAITDTELLVKHGLMTQRCKLAEIVEVYPTRNPLSSPALSLDRVFISTGVGFFKAIMISPEPRAEFMAELAQKANLKKDGEKLVKG